MKTHMLSIFRCCMIAGLSIAVLGGVADAAQRKSAAQCRKDWQTHRAMYQSEGKTRKTFMRECQAGTMKRATKPTAPEGTKGY